MASARLSAQCGASSQHFQPGKMPPFVFIQITSIATFRPLPFGV